MLEVFIYPLKRQGKDLSETAAKEAVIQEMEILTPQTPMDQTVAREQIVCTERGEVMVRLSTKQT